jgi:RNA polymerase I-specific transcription initiation factor RRN3
MKHDQADKLDCLMYVLFEYISTQNGTKFLKKENFVHKYFCFSGIEQTKLLFKDLLNVFNKILLPTHDSSHVQFLLFYICSFHTVSSYLSCMFI